MKSYWLGNWGFALVLMLAFMFGTAGEANAQRIVIRPIVVNNYSVQQYGYQYGYYQAPAYGYPAPVYQPYYQPYPAYGYRPYQTYGNYWRPNVYSPWYRR